MISRRRQTFVVALVLAAAPALAQPQRSAEEWATVLEAPERVQRLQVPRVVGDLGLEPGAVVADIGAGSGLFSRPIARAIAPRGVVYAVDVDQGLLAIATARARAEGLENVRPVVGGEDDPRLPDKVDVALVCDTLHHIEKRTAYLANLKKYLKPGGRVAILDYDTNWPPGHEMMRFTLEELRGWMREAGYRETAEYGYLRNMFFVVWQYGPA